MYSEIHTSFPFLLRDIPIWRYKNPRAAPRSVSRPHSRPIAIPLSVHGTRARAGGILSQALKLGWRINR